MIAVVIMKADAAEFHLSLAGSGSNPETAEQPFKTFSQAVTLLKPGDTLVVREGRYTKPLLLVD